jgi:hypothetical protein
VFTAITRIIARAVFTVFSTSNLICAQIHWVLRPLFTRSTAATYELFLASSQVPPFACYGVACHPWSLIANHGLRSWRRRWANSRRWLRSRCWARPRG